MMVYTKQSLRRKETNLLGHYSRLHQGTLWQWLQDGSVAVIGTDGKLGLLEPGTFSVREQKT